MLAGNTSKGNLRMIRPRHLHGLGPDFENHVRLQLKLDDNWSIAASGIEEVEIKTVLEGIENLGLTEFTVEKVHGFATG